MKLVLDFLIAHPEYIVAGLSLVESAVMPFIPIKWNGIAVTVFNFLKKKKG